MSISSLHWEAVRKQKFAEKYVLWKETHPGMVHEIEKRKVQPAPALQRDRTVVVSDTWKSSIGPVPFPQLESYYQGLAKLPNRYSSTDYAMQW